MPFATELAAAVSQHAQELDIVLLEEWQHAVIEQIGRRDGHLAVVELGKAYLGIGVDEGLRCVQRPSGCRLGMSGSTFDRVAAGHC